MERATRYEIPPTLLPLNSLTPYLRAHLDVSDSTLHWDSWWTAVGFVPVRRDRLSLPVADLAEARSRVGVHWDRLAISLGLLASISILPQRWMALPAIGAAAVLLVMAPTAQLRVSTRSGRTRRLSLCILHRIDVDLVAAALASLGQPRAAPTRASRHRDGPRTDPISPGAGTPPQP